MTTDTNNIEVKMKKCKGLICNGAEVPIDNFYKTGRYCRPCEAARQRAYRERKNKNKIKPIIPEGKRKCNGIFHNDEYIDEDKFSKSCTYCKMCESERTRRYRAAKLANKAK